MGRSGTRLVALALAVFTPVVVRAAEPTLFLSIDTNTADRRTPAAPPTKQERRAALTVMLNGMPDPAKAELSRTLEELAAGVKRRRNPFFVSVAEEDTSGRADKLLPLVAPSLTAGAALVAGVWRSAEGDFEVRLSGRCPAEGHCLPLFSRDPRNAEEGRARFVAWPWGYAIMVKMASRAEAEQLAAQVRAENSQTMALVLTASDMHRLRESATVGSLRAHARTLADSLPKGEWATLVSDLANLGRGAAFAVELPDQAILVVPRLGTLATHEGFVQEVHRRLHRPESSTKKSH